MSKMITKRRHRHRANAVIKFGKAAVRKHMRKSGRTGGVWSKRTHGKHDASADTHPKDGDVQQAPLVSGAVPGGQTPKGPTHDQ